jgi:dsDNA-binding SOS-regulon protein
MVQDQLYEILQKALQALHEETQRKLSFLVGDQLEFKRQYDQIQWMESFLRYQQDMLNPADYLSAWARHASLRNDLLNTTPVPQISNVQVILTSRTFISKKSSLI